MEQGFKVKIQGDNQDLDQAIEKSQNALKGFMGGIGGVVKNIGELKIEYRQLSRTSLEGKTPQEIDKIIGRMVELKDQIGDTEAMLNSLSGDNFEKVGEAAQSASTMIAGVTGAMSLFGAEGERLNELTQKTIGLLAIARAAQEATVMFSERAYGIIIKQKYNEISARLKEVLTIKSVTAASIAENTAKTKGIATTNLITRAQEIWNRTVAKNPVIALVAAVMALGAAVYALNKRYNEAKGAQDDYNRAADGTIIKNKDLRESYNDTLREINRITLELRLMRGEITQHQFDLAILDDEFSETMAHITDETSEAIDKTTSGWRGFFKFFVGSFAGMATGMQMHMNDIVEVFEDAQVKMTSAADIYAARRERLSEAERLREEQRAEDAARKIQDLQIAQIDNTYIQRAERLRAELSRELKEWEDNENVKKELLNKFAKDQQKIADDAMAEADANTKKYMDELARGFQDFKLDPIEVEIDWGDPLEDLEIKFIELKDNLMDLTDELNHAISMGMADLAAAFAEGVGMLASGEGTMDDVLQNVAGSVAGFMDMLGKSLIASGMASEAFKSLLVSGTGAIAAGAALVALAAITRAKLSKGPAGGGATPMPAMVGGSTSAGGAYGARDLGDFSINVRGELVAHGSDLVAVIDSENQRVSL